MFLGLLILAVIAFGYMGWFDSHCELKDLRKEVRQAREDIHNALPKATHSVRKEVMEILGRLKC